MKVIAGQNGGGGVAVAGNVTTKRVGSGEHMLLFYFFLVGISFVLAWLVSIEKPYTAGSDIGYNIGVVFGTKTNTFVASLVSVTLVVPYPYDFGYCWPHPDPVSFQP